MLSPTAKGVIYAVLAYTAWGLFPAFWRMLSHVSSGEIVAQRVLWSGLLFVAILAARGRLHALAETFRAPRKLKILVITSALLGLNWYLYVYAVTHGQILQSSLGYFITPLLNVFLGMVFLKERLRPAQWVALGLAIAGVALQAWQGQAVPYIALGLAFTFGTYGLLRKQLVIDSITGSTFESIFLLVPTFALAFAGGSFEPFSHLPSTMTLLIVGGALTGLPLLWFAEGAKRLPLSTIGFFQYIAPSISFLLAVFVYGEQFNAVSLRSFGLIWVGLALYTTDFAVARLRVKARGTPAPRLQRA